MQTVDLYDAPPLRFEGVLDTRRTPNGLRMSRLPRAVHERISDPGFSWVADVPSGARMVMRTDSTAIELDVQLMRLQVGDRPMQKSAFDLVVNGELRDGRTSEAGHVVKVNPLDRTDMRIVRGSQDTIRFDGLAPTDKLVEIWLPNASLLELRAVRVDDGATVTVPEPSGRRNWVHYGSSISHCVEADRPTGVWPVVAARLAGVDLYNLGIGGQAQLDHAVARVIGERPADMISMKVGINVVNGDTMRLRTFRPAVHAFIDTIREAHPAVPLLVITPIICPAAEDHPGPTLMDADDQVYVVERPVELREGALTLTKIRDLLATIVDERQRDGDANISLMSGLDLFGPQDVPDLPDGLHPNSAGYRRMGERFHALAFAGDGPFA